MTSPTTASPPSNQLDPFEADTAEDVAVALIKRWEGLELQSYRDSVGVWTIGYGHTRTARRGQSIDEATAEQLLRADLENHAAPVWAAIKRDDVNHWQRGAVASLAFNVGVGAVTRSTLLRKLNAGDFHGAANEFPRWNKAGGRVLRGLTRRRAHEQSVFLHVPDDPDNTTEAPDVPETRIERSTTVWATLAAMATYLGDFFRAIPAELAWLAPVLIVGGLVWVFGERIRKWWQDGR